MKPSDNHFVMPNIKRPIRRDSLIPQSPLPELTDEEEKYWEYRSSPGIVEILSRMEKEENKITEKVRK